MVLLEIQQLVKQNLLPYLQTVPLSPDTFTFMKVVSFNSEGGRHEDHPKLRKDTGFPTIRFSSLWDGKQRGKAVGMGPPAICFVCCSGRSRQSFWEAAMSGSKIPLFLPSLTFGYKKKQHLEILFSSTGWYSIRTVTSNIYWEAKA